MGLTGDLIAYLNRLRAENGVPQVMHRDSGVSNLRASYMLRRNLFSHYNENGIHPGVFFSLANNYYSGEENIGLFRSNRPFLKNEAQVLGIGKDLIWRMVYEDGGNGWGHRDSLLDPCFNYADVSVAWDSRRVFLVVTMIGVWVDWEKPPSLRGGILSLSGKTEVMRPEQVIIFYDSPNPSYVSKEYYDFGEPVAGLTSGDFYYGGLRTIKARKWRMDSRIELEFPFYPYSGKGVYTLVISGKDTRPLKWNPVNKSRLSGCKLLTFSFVYYGRRRIGDL